MSKSTPVAETLRMGRAETQTSRPGWRRGFLLTLAATMLFAATLATSYQLLYAQRVPLGVRMLDLELEAMSRQEALYALGARFGAYDLSPMTLTYQDRQWALTPRELGARFDPEATLATAMRVGRQGGVLDRLQGQSRALTEGEVILPTFRVDEEALKQALVPLRQAIDQQPITAGLAIEGLNVIITPSRPGRTIDDKTLTVALTERFAVMSIEPVALPVVTVAPARVEADLGEAKAKAQTMVSAPVQVRYLSRNWEWTEGPLLREQNHTWQLDQRAIAALVRFRDGEIINGIPELRIELNPDGARAHARAITKEVDQSPKDARFGWNGGKLIPLPEYHSREGRRVDEEVFIQRLSEAVLRPDRTLELPVAVSKPAVAMEDAAKMGIIELIQERSTYFGGAISERDYNIVLGAQKLNGIVVPPGATFSFNDNVGEITAAAGYQIGFSIVEQQTVPDVGGGICQVATTLFQSAFWAGYPVVERYPHAYRITRYEEPLSGLDATIYPPYTDFKFRNDTTSYILIETRTQGKRLYIALYGTKPTWSVEVGEPVFTDIIPADKKVIIEESPALARGREIWVEKAEDGVTVSLQRLVRLGDQVLRQSTFVSRYRPQRNVKVVGTGS